MKIMNENVKKFKNKLFLKVYSVLGLLMVGTFNIEKDKLLDKPSHNWPNSPTYQGGGSPILPTPEWTLPEEIDGMTEEELKDFEKKKSIEFNSIYLLIM